MKLIDVTKRTIAVMDTLREVTDDDLNATLGAVISLLIERDLVCTGCALESLGFITSCQEGKHRA